MKGTAGNEYREQRLENMRRLKELGYRPFGRAFERTDRLAGIRAAFEDGKRVAVAGRLMTVRDMGKSIFCDLHDGSDRFQVYAQKKELGDDAFGAFQFLDVGDHIGVEGTLFTTRTEEPTVKIERWELLAKALLPLPEKWHGLRDVEARYRQRYLDLIANPAVRELFDRRSRAIREIRAFMTARGYCEVETPMLERQAGGAAAKPFITHYDSLGADMALRIALELNLKRLLVGGYDKVFELNRCFRNEGLSRTHAPEFTMMEMYEAYTDARGMQGIIQDLILHLADKVFGTRKVGSEADPIDLEPPWREANYADLVRDAAGEDWYDLDVDASRRRVEERGLTTDPAWGKLLITHEVYEKIVEKSLVRPTFVLRFPAELIPLAATCEDDPSAADVFELVIGGQEIAPGYTELNDPLAQRERLAQQVGEEQDRLDEDFITALEHGMPPAGGMGVGIDRLLVILAGADSIRDVILFPQLRLKK